MTPPIRRTYLDFEELCQLTWVGRLISVPGPKENIVVRAYFTKVLVPSKEEAKVKRVGNAFWKDIPIGDILDIPIGTLFYRGVPANQSTAHSKSIHDSLISLDFGDDNVKIIDRWMLIGKDETSPASDKLLLPRTPSSLPQDPNYSGSLLYVGEGDNPFAYAIPCYEVFRFFYAVSSRMADVFLNSRFLDWNRYIWNSERSSIDFESKKALLWLRQWMLDQDAWFIASLAFDPISVERGMNIFRSIAVDQNRILRAVPPMHDRSIIKAKWIPIKNGLGSITKVITEILSTDWHPPFNKLQFDRDNDGRRAGIEDEGEKEPIFRPSANNGKPTNVDYPDDVIDLIDSPSNSALPPQIISIEEINDRFEWLMTAEVDKLPQLETHFEGDKYINLLNDRWSTLLSTMEGTSSAAAIQSVVLTSEDLQLLTSLEFEDDEIEDDDDLLHSPSNDLLTIAQGLVNIRENTNASVEFLHLWGKPIPIETFELFRLPKKISSESYNWLHKTKSKKSRLALAAKITLPNNSPQGAETRYIFDFEPNPKNSNIVIVWSNSGREITAFDLRRLIRGFAQARSVMKNRSGVNDIKIGHRKHTMAPNVLKNGFYFLERIFSTVED